jgi:hypothetical protein
VAAGRPTILNSRPSPAPGITAFHAYALLGYDAGTQKFTLYNPQGSTVQLTWDQIVQSFDGYWQMNA